MGPAGEVPGHRAPGQELTGHCTAPPPGHPHSGVPGPPEGKEGDVSSLLVTLKSTPLFSSVVSSFFVLNWLAERRADKRTNFAEEAVFGHQRSCDCRQLLWPFHCSPSSVWRCFGGGLSHGTAGGGDLLIYIIVSSFSHILLGADNVFLHWELNKIGVISFFGLLCLFFYVSSDSCTVMSLRPFKMSLHITVSCCQQKTPKHPSEENFQVVSS